MPPSKFSLAKPRIDRFFASNASRVFSYRDLVAILATERSAWGLPKKTTAKDLIEYLSTHAQMSVIELPFSHRGETRYTWGKVSILEVLSSAIPRGYFTHHTAARLHKLTPENFHRIYINHEQSPHQRTSHLTQEGIDRAFSRPQRTTNNIIELNDYRVYVLNGMNTAELGVYEHEGTFDGAKIRVRCTNVERTLIDMTVRPLYAGGTSEVLRSYKKARKHASAKTLAEMLASLNYVYPYHQAIGFYLEAAGYPDSDLKPFRDIPMNFDFYLAPQMSSQEFITSWRIHVPKSILAERP